MKSPLKHKLGLTCIGASLLLIITSVYAQSFFSSPPKPANNTQNSAIPQSRVLSKDSFNKTVDTMGQKNLNALSQQTQETIMKPSPPPPAKPSGARPTTPPPSTSSYNATVAPGTSASPPPAVAGANTQPTAGTTAPSPAAAPTQPASSQVYTGFGAGAPTNKNTQSGKENSGWSIQY